MVSLAVIGADRLRDVRVAVTTQEVDESAVDLADKLRSLIDHASDELDK